MNRKAAAVLSVVMIVAVASIGIFTDWNEFGTGMDREHVNDYVIPFTPEDLDGDGEGALSEKSLNKVLFEKYGAVLIVLGIVMFTAMIAGVCVSREEEDNDD